MTTSGASEQLFPIRRRIGFGVAAVAIVAGASSLVLTLGAGVVLVPDVELYLAGAGLFPSPAGTLLGELGFVGLALVHAVAVAGLWAIVYAAGPSFVSLAIAAPFLAWTVPLGVDSLAAVAIASGFLLAQAGVERGALAVLPAAALHPASIPALCGVLMVARRGLGLAYLLAGLGAAGLFLTPYGGPLTHGGLGVVAGAAVGAIVVVLALAPLLRAPARDELAAGLVWALAIGTWLTASYAAAADFARLDRPAFGLVLFAAMRYALPLSLCVLLAGRVHRMGDRSGLRRLRDRRADMRLKAFSLTVAVVALAALVLVPAAFAQTVPAIPVDDYGDALLSSLASAIGQVFPYAAAITAFAIGVGLVKRWLGHRRATAV